ncbi:helix-turn-helix domain-containing protein, partial [Klebsiella pneumoniae]
MMTMRGFKQADLVRKSKISKAAISSLLSDPSKNLRVRSLLSIAKALGCDPLWLFTGKESGTYITEIDIKKVSVLEISDIGDTPI